MAPVLSEDLRDIECATIHDPSVRMYKKLIDDHTHVYYSLAFVFSFAIPHF